MTAGGGAALAGGALVAAGVAGLAGIGYTGYKAHQAGKEASQTEKDMIARLKKQHNLSGNTLDELTAEMRKRREEQTKNRKIKPSTPSPITANTFKRATKSDRESARKQEEQAKETGKQIAMGFIEEMKENSEPSQVEFKFTFDDIVGANSPVHDILWNSINNSMVKKTA